MRLNHLISIRLRRVFEAALTLQGLAQMVRLPLCSSTKWVNGCGWTSIYIR